MYRIAGVDLYEHDSQLQQNSFLKINKHGFSKGGITLFTIPAKMGKNIGRIFISPVRTHRRKRLANAGTE